MQRILSKTTLKTNSTMQSADDFLYATIAETSLLSTVKRVILEHIQKTALILTITAIIALTIGVGIIKAKAKINAAPNATINTSVPIQKIHI